MTDTRQAPVHALLTDGTTVRIRRADPGDRDAVLRLYEEMSPENLRLRFFVASEISARQSADRAADARRPDYCALVAEQDGRLVGLAEYDALPKSPRRRSGWPSPTNGTTEASPPCSWNTSPTPPAAPASPRSAPGPSPRTTRC